jgi:bifunctional non-homologous end joining protein LigD
MLHPGRYQAGSTKKAPEEKGPGPRTQGTKIIIKRRGILQQSRSYRDSTLFSAVPINPLMSLRLRTTRSSLGFVEPCLPSPAKHPPAGSSWIHEIKHDGFRIMARRDAGGVRLITRNGNDFTARFPLAVEAVSRLPARSFLLDSEAIVTNERGLAVFDLIRRSRNGKDAVLIAFDLIELEGEDLRRTPIEQRKRKLGKLVRGPHPGIVLNEVFEGDGEILFEHACKLGCEGIVSKRLGSPYRSGRADCWIKVKNPKAPAVKREAEEDWGRSR